MTLHCFKVRELLGFALIAMFKSGIFLLFMVFSLNEAVVLSRNSCESAIEHFKNLIHNHKRMEELYYQLLDPGEMYFILLSYHLMNYLPFYIHF